MKVLAAAAICIFICTVSNFHLKKYKFLFKRCLNIVLKVLAAAAKWLEHDLAARLGLADRFFIIILITMMMLMLVMMMMVVMMILMMMMLMSFRCNSIS